MAFLVTVVVFAAAAFAALTYTITSYTDVHLTESGKAVDGEVEPLTFFYLWHLANAMPGNPMEKLLVSPLYHHHSRMIGAFVLAFAIAFVVPVITYCTDLVSWRRERREKKEEEGAAQPES